MSGTRSGPWWCIALATVVGLVVACTGCSSSATGAGATVPPRRPTTIVSLTFDDGLASHATAMTMLRDHGMAGTFYIIPGLVGAGPYYLPWAGVHALADAGNEVGAHTVHHADLTTVDAPTAQAEACGSRTALLAQGFSPVTAFAYPDGGVNPAVEAIVARCGFTSARGVGDLFGPSCPCAYAETLPPADSDDLRTAPGATTGTSVADLETSVTNAESHGGGWVVLVFHGICDDQCTGPNSVTTATFGQLLDWLGPRAAHGTAVRTVGQAMAGASGPT